MWRQLTIWLGGMGIIVLALAVLPRLRVGGRQLFESEAPGPEVEPLADDDPRGRSPLPRSSTCCITAADVAHRSPRSGGRASTTR